MALTVREYLTADGKNPFREWLGSLTKAVKARIQARVLRFELGNLGDHKSVGEGVWEARVMFGPGYRIYFGKDGDSIIVLLVGGDKDLKRRTSRGHEDSGATIWRRKSMARRHEDWNVGLAEDLRDPSSPASFYSERSRRKFRFRSPLARLFERWA